MPPEIAEKELQTIADRLSDELVGRIVRGDLAPGSKINEPALARRFHVSRGPLREAIRRLEGLHLVDRVPHVGARVVSLQSQQLQEVYCVREALEGMAARLAAEHMPGEEIASLKILLDTHQQNIRQSGGTEYFQQEGDFDFHYRLIQGSGNRWLTALLCSELYHVLRMVRYRSSLSNARPQRALAEHRQILAAIEERDAELAEILMRRHIARARQNLQRQSSEGAQP